MRSRRVGGPKFRAFNPSPPQISFFLPSLAVFSWNFGGFEEPGPSNVHAWSSRAVVVSQTPPQFHEKTPREGKKKRNWKGGPAEGGSGEGEGSNHGTIVDVLHCIFWRKVQHLSQSIIDSIHE